MNIVNLKLIKIIFQIILIIHHIYKKKIMIIKVILIYLMKKYQFHKLIQILIFLRINQNIFQILFL